VTGNECLSWLRHARRRPASAHPAAIWPFELLSALRWQRHPRLRPLEVWLACKDEIGNNDGVIAAGGDALVVEVVDALDGPVTGDPDGVEAPPGSR
jgi:hypothetical protein